jgi:hypothetical protein
MYVFVGTNFRGFYKMHWIRGFKHYRQQSMDKIVFRWRIFPGSMTDLSAWEDFRTASPQYGVKYQLWYLKKNYGGGSQWLSHKNKSRTAKFLHTWIEPTLHKRKFKYQSWYLKPYCGLEVQKPTQSLTSVKGPGNIFYSNPRWASPQAHSRVSNINFDIWIFFKEGVSL